MPRCYGYCLRCKHFQCKLQFFFFNMSLPITLCIVLYYRKDRLMTSSEIHSWHSVYSCFHLRSAVISKFNPSPGIYFRLNATSKCQYSNIFSNISSRSLLDLVCLSSFLLKFTHTRQKNCHSHFKMP